MWPFSFVFESLWSLPSKSVLFTQSCFFQVCFPFHNAVLIHLKSCLLPILSCVLYRQYAFVRWCLCVRTLACMRLEQLLQTRLRFINTSLMRKNIYLSDVPLTWTLLRPRSSTLVWKCRILIEVITKFKRSQLHYFWETANSFIWQDLKDPHHHFLASQHKTSKTHIIFLDINI